MAVLLSPLSFQASIELEIN